MHRPARLILGLSLCATGAPVTRAAADESPASKQLHSLFDAEWEWTMRENPTWASSLGDLRYNDRWPDVSLEA